MNESDARIRLGVNRARREWPKVPDYKFSEFLCVVLNEDHQQGVSGIDTRVGEKRPRFRMLATAAGLANSGTVARQENQAACLKKDASQKFHLSHDLAA